jgi:hypothetical protein
VSNVTSLHDARVAKQMGIPLTTPFEQRPVSRVVARHWGQLEKHTRLLEDVTSDWLGEVQLNLPHDESWALLNRRVQKLGKVFEKANSALCRIMGIPVNSVGPTPLTGEQEAARLEADPSAVILCNLLPRVRDYLNFWQEFINEVCASEPGDTLDIAHLLNAPIVFDKEAAS